MSSSSYESQPALPNSRDGLSHSLVLYSGASLSGSEVAGLQLAVPEACCLEAGALVEREMGAEELRRRHCTMLVGRSTVR